MPQYDYICRDCQAEWSINMSMADKKGHQESCPGCDKEALQVFDGIGMIKVTGGTSPTRIGRHYQRTKKAADGGFQKELDSIWNADGPENPNTGERYEVFDDEGSSGTYMGLASEKKKWKEGAAEAQRRGTLPSNKKQEADKVVFNERQLERARKRKREKSPQQKGSKS